jgi:hypothetical protein
MPLSPKLEYKLSKTYAPSAQIDDVYNGKDITFVTNERGEPVTLFIGKRREDGAVAGERYVRRIARQPNSDEIKSSHWDNKGKVTRFG